MIPDIVLYVLCRCSIHTPFVPRASHEPASVYIHHNLHRVIRVELGCPYVDVQAVLGPLHLLGRLIILRTYGTELPGVEWHVVPAVLVGGDILWWLPTQISHRGCCVGYTL